MSAAHTLKVEDMRHRRRGVLGTCSCGRWELRTQYDARLIIDQHAEHAHRALLSARRTS